MKKKYWYKFFYEECPVCGRLSNWKERIFDQPKPKEVDKRYVYFQVWDYCNY